MNDTVATFAVAEYLIIDDPCQLLATSGNEPAIRLSVPNSTWEAYTEDPTSEGFVGRLILNRVDKRAGYFERSVELAGKVGVDTGQVMVVDAARLPLSEAAYEEACESHDYRDIGEFEGGAICGTGYGDGSYSVDVTRNKDGDIVAVEIAFVEEDEPECSGCGREEDWCECCPDCDESPCVCEEEE